MLKKYCLATLCLMLFACSKEEGQGNSAPSEFELEDLSFTGTKVSFRWFPARDADEDEVFYHVYLNSELIKGPITTNQLSTTLEYNKEYQGLVIATDKNGGTAELKFSFRSPSSKIVYITDFQTSQVVAIDLYTRTRLWTGITSSRINSVHKGLVYGGFKQLYAYDFLTGEKVWEGQPVENSHGHSYRHILTDDRFLFAKLAEDRIISIDLERREKQWEISVFDSDFRFSMDRDHLYVTKRNNHDLIAVNKISGERAWGFQLDRSNSSLASRIEHAPLVYEGNVYFQDNNGRFYSLNKHTGVKNYSLFIGDDSQSAPVAANGNIIFTAGNQILSVEAATGRINWRKDFGAHSRSSPFVDGEKVYVGAGNKLYCLDVATGAQQWDSDLGGNVYSSPVVYDQKVYIGSHTQRLHCVNAQTGEIEWEEGNVEFTASSPTLVIGDSDQIIHSSDYGLHH